MAGGIGEERGMVDLRLAMFCFAGVLVFGNTGSANELIRRHKPQK